MKTKKCRRKVCKDPIKPQSSFYKKTANKDGLQDWCKECEKETNAQYKKENAERCKAIQKKASQKWYKNNKVQHIAYVRNWESRNPDKVKKHQKKYDTKMMKSLSDIYVRGVLTNNNPELFAKDIPQGMIEIKRDQLKLYRLTKE